MTSEFRANGDEIADSCVQVEIEPDHEVLIKRAAGGADICGEDPDDHDSPRAEVSEESIRVLDPIVRARRGLVPGFSTVEIIIGDMCLGSVEYRLHATAEHGGACLVACVLIWDEESADEVWRQMREAKVAVDRPAHLPQLLVGLCPGIAVMPRKTVAMLGDLERCIAWAILAQEGLTS